MTKPAVIPAWVYTTEIEALNVRFGLIATAIGCTATATTIKQPRRSPYQVVRIAITSQAGTGDILIIEKNGEALWYSPPWLAQLLGTHGSFYRVIPDTCELIPCGTYGGETTPDDPILKTAHGRAHMR